MSDPAIPMRRARESRAETILEEIGIELRRDPESLRLWRQAGADVRGERVRIPRGLARQLIATAPSEFTLFARNPARDVRVWKRMLAEYQDPGIDPARDEAMLDFIAHRKAVLTDDITDE